MPASMRMARSACRSSVDTQYFPVEDLNDVPVDAPPDKDASSGQGQRECVRISLALPCLALLASLVPWMSG